MHPGTGKTSIAPILITGSIITAPTLGVRATMGLFPDAIDRALDVGIGTVGLTVALQNLVWGLGQPLAGTIADRFGAARTLLVGAIAYAGGLLVMGAANGPAGLHLGGGVIVGLGMSAASFAVVLSSMSRLVDPHRRSMALGVATACGSLGHFVLVPLTGAFLGSWGGGEIRELTGSYDLWWWLAAALGVAAAAIHFSISEEPAPARPEHRRRASPSAA